MKKSGKEEAATKLGEADGAWSELSMADAIRWATFECMESDEKLFFYGQGVNDPSGAGGTTQGLLERFGPERVFDVPNSENCVLGLGLGASLLGLKGILLFKRLDFLLLAFDQLVNEGARWPAITGHSSPSLVIRAVMGNEGWGQGAQHTGTFWPVLCHFPGITVAMIANAQSAMSWIKQACDTEGIHILIEPRACYEWRSDVVPAAPAEPLRTLAEGSDCSLICCGEASGFAMSLRAAAMERGYSCEVIEVVRVSSISAAVLSPTLRSSGKVGVLELGWDRYSFHAEICRLICEAGLKLAAPVFKTAMDFRYPAASRFLEPLAYPSRRQCRDGFLRWLEASVS